jgi:uncharacterized phage protein gp47/JayE
MALATIDETGLHLPDYSAVLDSVQTAMRGIYGEDLYLEADSQDGQLAAIFAEALYDAYNLAGSVYNSFSPTSAQYVSLSRQVAINGIRRKTATYSTAAVRIVGAVGTVLTGAIAQDGQQVNWLIPDGTAIPLAGEIVVTATAETAGDIRAAAGDISMIATPMLGWHSVTNPEAATPGAAVELDAALRRRQKISTARPSRTVLDGIAGAVAEIEGVTRVKPYENDTDEADADGIPPHTISLVVEGGDTTEIAEAIAGKKAPGCGTFGNTAVTVTDKYGMPITIRFWRRVEAALKVRIRLRALAGYLAVTGEEIATNVAAFINALDIGEDVLLSQIYTPVNAANGSPKTFDVLEIALALDGGDYAVANLAIPYNAAAACTAADVEVIVE